MELKMKYKALALDLDGTLTDSSKNLSDEHREAVMRAAKNGVHIILASGRPLFGITPIARKLELEKLGGYILAYNGGNIVDCKTGGIVYENLLPMECKKDICSLARQAGVYALTYDKDVVVAESDTDYYVVLESKCNDTTIKRVDNLDDYVDYEVAKFLVVGPHEKLIPVQQALLEKHGDKLNAFYSEDYFLEVVPKTVAKDKALAQLLEKLGVSRDELVACGDGMNDIPMLKFAGLAVAMENAYPEVKEHADYIAPSNDNNGIADVVDKFF
jgi:hypothetical protein